MQLIFYILFALGIAGTDQLTKYLVVEKIPFAGSVSFVPGVMELTYVKNTGAAFSSFQGMRWMFVVVFLVLTVLLIWEYRAKYMPFTTFDRWCIAAIYGGGLGNIIDRVFRGYVVDMLKTQFIDFPVFNVADCFITCGCILLIVHLLCSRDLWKSEKK